MHSKSGLRNVFLGNPDLMVTLSKVNLTKHLGSAKPIKHLVDTGDRVVILDHESIEGMIVNTHT